MAEILVKQEDGTYITLPIRVEIRGVGTVVNPISEEKEDG